MKVLKMFPNIALKLWVYFFTVFFFLSEVGVFVCLFFVVFSVLGLLGFFFIYGGFFSPYGYFSPFSPAVL